MSDGERRCPNCAALVSADAEWCGQCFTSLREAEAGRAGTGAARSIATEAEPVAPEGPASERAQGSTRLPATWPCPTCGRENPIDLDVCMSCGTSFATLMRSGERPPQIDPARALRRSLIFPGLGHALTGHGADGLARGLLFSMLVMMATIIGSSGISGGILLTVFALFAGTAVVIYLGSAWEAYRLAAGEEAFVSSRTVLWVTVGVVMLSVGLLAMAVTTATKR
jgi:hypothetical protein